MENLQRKDKLIGFDTPTIWSKSGRLALTQGCANLGQGFPDWNPPEFIFESFNKHLNNPQTNHQYTRAYGTPKLIEAISDTYSEVFKRKINPLTEILVTNGAVSALYNSITGLVEAGDEVIFIEPFYDCYLPQSIFSGAKVIGVPMISPKVRKFKEIEITPKSLSELKDDWQIDFDKLKGAINEKTRILILNTPNNPTGKILKEEELNRIAELIKDYPNLVVIMDEVYEYMIYEGFDVLPRFANIPGMWDRTISIMSAGKIFSMTGARIGWCIGPHNLINRLCSVHQVNSFCIYDPMQLTIADALVKAKEPYQGYENYYKWLKALYTEQRNFFFDQFSKIKDKLDIDLFFPEGGYMAIAAIPEGVQINKSNIKYEGDEDVVYGDDTNYVCTLAADKKVNIIPCSVFYTNENKSYGQRFLRLAFCKSKSTIEKACTNWSNNTK
jgi:aspartate/methionine/tyrosine aminotransferase